MSSKVAVLNSHSKLQISSKVVFDSECAFTRTGLSSVRFDLPCRGGGLIKIFVKIQENFWFELMECGIQLWWQDDGRMHEM